MAELAIDETVIQWSVNGVRSDEAAALSALSEYPLLVLLHGYGSHEGDLIGLAPELPGGFVCASLRAPIKLGPPIVNGYGWWQIVTPGYPDLPVINQAAETVLAWLDKLSARLDAGLGEIALLGFSQGGLMVTQLYRHAPTRFSAGIICSGFVAGGELPGDAELAANRPALFWGRDVDDPIITQVAIDRTLEWLPVHSTLTEKLYPGIAHSISLDEIRDINEFLFEQVPSLKLADAHGDAQ